MSARRLQDWQWERLVEFADMDSFTVGYLWGLTIVGEWPICFASGVSFFSRGDLGLCSLFEAIGLSGLALVLDRLRRVTDAVRESNCETRRRQ